MAFWKKKEERADENTDNVITSSNIGIVEAFINSGAVLTRQQAWEISAVQSCITFIADKVAALPVKLYENKDGKVSEVKDDKRTQLLNGDTGDTLNATEMRREWIKDYYLGKGAYTYIEKDVLGEVKSLRYVSEEQISTMQNQDPIFKSYSMLVQGKEYFPYQFLKILRNTKGYGVGMPITQEKPLLFSVAYNTMKYENVLVKKGGNKKGFLMAKTHLGDAAMNALKTAWRKLYENGADNDNVIVLNDGMDFKESSSTSVEMQLNERKESNRKEICSVFEVPYDVINGKADAAVQSQWIKNCITPLLNVIEAALDSDLLKENEKSTRYFAFDTAELTRGDFTSRMNGYAVALKNNIMQLDEVRAREDLEPTGFNFMRLGLNDVLLDMKTNRIYTPNTNQYQNLGAPADNETEFFEGDKAETEKEDKSLTDEENRANHLEARTEIHGPNGKIIDNVPDGNGGAVGNIKSDASGVDKAAESGIIEEKGYDTSTINSSNVKMSAHAIERAAERSVTKEEIIAAIDNPLEERPVKLDNKGRPSFQRVGESATVAINPKNNELTSTWKTHSKIKRKLKGAKSK